MTNKEVAAKFNLLAKLMELYGENQFKIRSYSNAYLTIRKLDVMVMDLTADELADIKGVGKAIAEKILHLKDSGSFPTLERYLEKTPDGIVELLGIKGLGAKKVRQLWDELEINSPGELLYACNENRLVDLKGFGEKTQNNIREATSYFLDSKGSYLYGHIENSLDALLDLLYESLSDFQWFYIGDVARKMPVVNEIEILTDCDDFEQLDMLDEIEMLDEEFVFEQIKFSLIYTSAEEIATEQILSSCSDTFRMALPELASADDEESVFINSGLPIIPAEFREDAKVLKYSTDQIEEIIEIEDIKGVIHNHTTYSDGIHSLEQMADAAYQKGYEYIVITDHSKSAFYANGLQVDRLLHQIDAIDQLNKKYETFKIYSGIESDILNDGSLDYGEDILKLLDVVIASVHSNLKMTEEKATSRLITAIEQKHTRILGHPTGRLLLSRKAYPIDHKKVIDACAANDVVMEINANPYRLDLDWQWVDYCMAKGVMLSINPDAHAISGIDDIKYGVYAARKGGLTKQMTLNAKTVTEFETWMNAK